MSVLNVVVDISHHNRVSDFNEVKNDGIEGIIHKATQGFRFIDNKYSDRKERALNAGLMWGAYHFGEGGDPIAQADHFLNTVQPGPEDLLVLDFEPNPNGRSMNLDEAEDFVYQIKEQTGKWPGLYSGHYIKDFLRTQSSSILPECWLWLAQYGTFAKIPSAWNKWTMWQYTDGSIGPNPHSVQGIGYCDRDKFNGTIDELKKLWSGEVSFHNEQKK